MNIRIVLIMACWLFSSFLNYVHAQERPRTVVLDRTLSISFGSTEYESSRFFEGDVFDQNDNKIIVFTIILRAAESPNFRDFTKLYCSIETTDLRKNPKYTWEDVQAGRISMREWANQPDNPRDSQKKMLSLPRPKDIQFLADRNETRPVTIYEKEDFKVSIELLSAEPGDNSLLFRDLTFRILIQGPEIE